MKINKNKLYVPAHQAVVDAQRRNVVADIRIATRRSREELTELVTKRLLDELKWGNLDGLSIYEDRESGPHRVSITSVDSVDFSMMTHADLSALALALTWGTYAVRNLTIMGHTSPTADPSKNKFVCEYWCYIEQTNAPRMRSFFHGVTSAWYYAVACAILANRAYHGVQCMDSTDPRALELRLSSTRTLDSLLASLNLISRTFVPLFNDEWLSSRPAFCKYVGVDALPLPNLFRQSDICQFTEFFSEMDAALCAHVHVPISLAYLAAGSLDKEQIRHESDQLYNWHKGREYEGCDNVA